jgi:hypothetical protein
VDHLGTDLLMPTLLAIAQAESVGNLPGSSLLPLLLDEPAVGGIMNGLPFHVLNRDKMERTHDAMRAVQSDSRTRQLAVSQHEGTRPGRSTDPKERDMQAQPVSVRLRARQLRADGNQDLALATAHPDTDADQLKAAVQTIFRSLWNEYYAGTDHAPARTT